MTRTDPAPDARLDGILRDAGLRVTQQRRAIIAVLQDADDHPNAEETLERARALDPSVSTATVYRTLSVLEEAGLVGRLALDNAPARFEMKSRRDHDHLIDVNSGEVIELDAPEIAALYEALARRLGYEVVSQHTILRGRRLG